MTEKEFLEQIKENRRFIHMVCNTYYESYPRQDLVQEITLELWRSINNFKNNCSFRKWIFVVARNKCITLLRKEKKIDIVGLDEYADTLVETNNAPDIVKQLRNAMRYDSVISTIEEPFRSTFEMYLHGLSYK